MSPAAIMNHIAWFQYSREDVYKEVCIFFLFSELLQRDILCSHIF